MSDRSPLSLRVAVVGATGLVGHEILELLTEREFPISELHLFASERSAGEEVEFSGRSCRVKRLTPDLPEIDLAFLCAPAEISRSVAEDLAEAGTTVIDLSPAHRLREGVPLVMAGWRPPEDLSRGVILSIPDALTALLAVPLRALAALSAPKRVIATALVGASAFGRRAVETLSEETMALLNAREPEPEGRPAMAFNCSPEPPEEGVLSRNAAGELRRLLELDIPVTITVVRAPIFHGQGVAVSIETEEPIPLDRLCGALRESPSILLDDNAARLTSTRKATGSEGIHIGGIHADPRDSSWIHFWATADNLRQGAGLNALAVAETVLPWRVRRSS